MIIFNITPNCHEHHVIHQEHKTYVIFLSQMFNLNLIMKNNEIKITRHIQIELQSKWPGSFKNIRMKKRKKGRYVKEG